MHLHRINVILRADQVLPKYLHIPNVNGKYMHVQCRQALASLSVLLKDYSSFVMLENHSYIKFITSEENGEKGNYFFMIRVIANFPCVVLHLAFINGTSGLLRHQVIKELREMIRNCKFQIRNVKSGLLKSHSLNSTTILERQDSLPLDVGAIAGGGGGLVLGQHLNEGTVHEASDDLIETNACVILRKPIEKVLIRYEKPPIDFFSPVDQHFFSLSTSENVEVNKIIKEEMMATLSRYLHHERWIWTPEQQTVDNEPPASKPISIQLLGKILSSLLRYGNLGSFSTNEKSNEIYFNQLKNNLENDWTKASISLIPAAMESSALLWKSRWPANVIRTVPTLYNMFSSLPTNVYGEFGHQLFIPI